MPSKKCENSTKFRTLFTLTRQYGWVRISPGKFSEQKSPIENPRAQKMREIPEEARTRVQKELDAIKAKVGAKRKLDESSLDTHPYLISKGFPEHKAWVWSGNLILPIMEPNGEISNVQIFEPKGKGGFDPRFLADGKISGCFLRLGTGTQECWIVEGYVTGLSVWAALDQLDRQDFCVVVAFCACNIPNVAEALGKGSHRYVIANHDNKGAGEKYAQKTDWPWWMPEALGQDANDLHQTEGLEALVGSLRDWLSKQPDNQ